MQATKTLAHKQYLSLLRSKEKAEPNTTKAKVKKGLHHGSKKREQRRYSVVVQTLSVKHPPAPKLSGMNKTEYNLEESKSSIPSLK